MKSLSGQNKSVNIEGDKSHHKAKEFLGQEMKDFICTVQEGTGKGDRL